MTYADLLDQIAGNADDSTGTYRTSARRWLNLTRADIASRGYWRSALRNNAFIQTEANKAGGVFGIGTSYEFISGDYLYDETNNTVIVHESNQDILGNDPDRSVTGQPSIWCDAGQSNAGERQIRLWPRPDATLTISFTAYLRLTDVTPNEDNDTEDNFFGKILLWGPCFAAGMRYYADLDNNEEVTQSALQRQAFDNLVRQRMRANNVAPLSSNRIHPVKGTVLPTLGRLDPAHFSNR